MQKALFTVLLLAAVAFSTSHRLPTIPMSDESPLEVDGQINDNTIRNRYNARDGHYNTRVFYTMPVSALQRYRLLRKQADYYAASKEKQKLALIFQEENYDDDGFRKEQWHNYPRQLDRLHEYLKKYRQDTARSLFPDISKDFGTLSNYEDLSETLSRQDYDTTFNNLRPHIFHDSRKITDTNNGINESVLKSKESFETYVEPQTKENNRGSLNDEEAKIDDMFSTVADKVKGGSPDTDISETSYTSKKRVTKRLFSLFSRLQSMSYKGHDLPHRRRMAIYAIPRASGGTLTAETRAQMRPPGSPLRWG